MAKSQRVWRRSFTGMHGLVNSQPIHSRRALHCSSEAIYGRQLRKEAAGTASPRSGFRTLLPARRAREQPWRPRRSAIAASRHSLTSGNEAAAIPLPRCWSRSPLFRWTSAHRMFQLGNSSWTGAAMFPDRSLAPIHGNAGILLICASVNTAA